MVKQIACTLGMGQSDFRYLVPLLRYIVAQINQTEKKLTVELNKKYRNYSNRTGMKKEYKQD